MAKKDEKPYSARSPAEYIESRVDWKTNTYRKKGNNYRILYLVSAATAAIAAAAVPVLINLNGVPPLVPTVLSLIVTVLVGLEGIFHWREHWKNYDLMKTSLRQESCLYQARGGEYRGKDDVEAFVLLVERVEEAIAKERAQTIEMRTSRTPDPREPKPRAAQAE